MMTPNPMHYGAQFGLNWPQNYRDLQANACIGCDLVWGHTDLKGQGHIEGHLALTE